MSTFGTEETIAAPLGPIWDALTNVARHHELLPSVDEVTVETAGESSDFEPGFAWTETRTFDGEQFVKTWTVSEFDPYVSFLADGPKGSRIRYALKPLGDEETTLSIAFDSGDLDDEDRAEALLQEDAAAIAAAVTGE